MATNNRSVLKAPAPSPEAPISGTALHVELSAMQDIALVLGQLDEPTRVRVLRWIEERFNVGAAVVTPPAPLYVVPARHPASNPGEGADDGTDESLSISALEDDFFARRGPKALKKPATDPAKQSVTGLLHDFVADFQDVVREWNVACDVPVDGRTVGPVRSIAS